MKPRYNPQYKIYSQTQVSKVTLQPIYLQIYKASYKNYYQEMDLLFIDNYCDLHFISNK